MKSIPIILFLTLWMIVGSCSTYYVSNKKVMEVQEGMTRQNVESILGQPDYRRFDGGIEEWEYRRISSVLYQTSMTIIISFEEGRVIGMNTFNGDELLPPPPAVMPPSVVVTPPVDYPHPERPHRRTLMTREEFDNFFRDFRTVIRDDEQVRLINNALNDYNFTSDQCKRIIGEITFADVQMQVMKKMYPQVVDKKNFHPIINKLSSIFDRNEMKQFLRDYHGDLRPGDIGYERPIAMSTEEFNRFFREYKEKDFQSQRSELLDEVLPPSGFTCAQCRKIVEMCTFHSEKKDMIKKLYPKIADKENFSVLTDVFDFDMDKREMREFAESYDSRR